MRIAIACSKNWFTVSDCLKEHHEVFWIRTQSELTEDALANFQPDYVFFPHWSWVVEESIHSQFNCIVFHTAPLPYGRGGSPIQNLILRGHTHAPVCAIQMTGDLDGGALYDKIDISLAGRLSEIFVRMNQAVNELIQNIVDTHPEPVPQQGEPTVFRRLGKSDNQIPSNLSLPQLYDRVRMLDDESYPNAYIVHGNYTIELDQVNLADNRLVCRAHIVCDDSGQSSQ